MEFFRKSFPDVDTGFHVAGYKKGEAGKASEPFVFYCHIGRNIFNERKNIKPDDTIAYGATWSGQIDILTGILGPLVLPGPEGKTLTLAKPPIIWDAMALQDAIDFSTYAMRTTIDTIRFQARPKNVGGPIDILIITRDGASWIQRKKLKGN